MVREKEGENAGSRESMFECIGGRTPEFGKNVKGRGKCRK